MKKNNKIAFLLALTVSFSGLAAQEEAMDKELSMSKVEEGCPRPGDCEGGSIEMNYYRHDPDDADYDVYTQGMNGEGQSEEKCKPTSCGKSGKGCRKGAAKSAQE